MSSFSTVRVKFRSACSVTNSASFVSSKMSWLAFATAPSFVLRVCRPLWAAFDGNSNGGLFVPLYTTPVTSGRLGSSSRCETTTSMPTRGMNCMPN